VLIALALATPGCRRAAGLPMPAALRPHPLCVERQPKDSRDLATTIAESLRTEGLDAQAAEPGACPADVLHHVTYIDNWNWDMRMYLKRVTIEVIDASTGEILAFGEAQQDSLGSLGLTHRDVIDRAAAQLVGRGDGG
jgi:hypothetical protein